MLPICRNVTCQLRFGYMSKAWNVSCVVSKYVDPQYDARRKYSGLTKLQPGLELKRCRNSPLYMSNSKRNVEYNLFLNLVDLAQQQFVLVKQITGLDWWAVIILCTVPLRSAVTYYLMMKTAQEAIKGKHIKELIDPILDKQIKKLDRGKYRHLSNLEKIKIHRKTVTSTYKRICKEQNYNPFAMIIYGLIPLPIWAANSWALRRLSGARVPFLMPSPGENEHVHPEMMTEGLLWFSNLCECDPHHILPVLCGCSFLVAIELNILAATNYGKNAFTPFIVKGFIFFSRVWSFIFIYIAWKMPSAMSFYWLVSGLTAVGCRLLFLHPTIQKKIYPEGQHLEINENPYRTIATNMVKRYNPKNWFL